MASQPFVLDPSAVAPPDVDLSKYDCLACGACCHAREGTILVTWEDKARWKQLGREDIVAQLTPGHFGQEAFAMRNGACVHLGHDGAPNACSIYEIRATICRAFEAGSQQCREFRRERGIDPPR